MFGPGFTLRAPGFGRIRRRAGTTGARLGDAPRLRRRGLLTLVRTMHKIGFLILDEGLDCFRVLQRKPIAATDSASVFPTQEPKVAEGQADQQFLNGTVTFALIAFVAVALGAAVYEFGAPATLTEGIDPSGPIRPPGGAPEEEK